jgi:molybdopterin synthase sulfur carrier subunit
MNVKMKFFASFRMLTGAAEIEVNVKEDARTGDLLSLVRERYEGFEDKTVLFAVNGEYVGEDAGLMEGDVVAFFPPVSGG